MTDTITKRIEQMKRGKVPEGYKKENGKIIPTAWNSKKLGDILHKVGRKVDVEKGVYYTQIGIRSHGNGLFYKEPVSGEKLGNKAVFWIEKDCFVLNIVFAWEQAIGKTTEKEVGMIGSHRFPMYRAIPNEASIDYLIWFFKTKMGIDILEAASPGGAGRNKTLGQKEFANSKIYLPPFSEQEKIAKILTHCNKVIELKKQLISTERDRNKWLIQNLLNPRSGVRLDGFDGEWKNFRLSENGSTYGGLMGKCAEDFGEGKPYIPYLNIFANYIIKNGGYDYVAIYDGDKQNKVNYGDILFTTSSETPEEVGMSAVYLENEEELYLNSFSFGYRLTNFCDLLPEFAAYFFNSQYIKKLMYKLAQGATRYNLSKIDLMKQSVLIPPTIDEQKAIAKILSTAERKIELLEQELEQWQQKKKALMQLLLTGIVRV
jgi:type I restriction enzyme S subunit